MKGEGKKGRIEGEKRIESETEMPPQKYKVNLSQAERESLQGLIQNEAPRSRRVKHAKILLESDLGKSAAKVAAWVGVGDSTVERTRQRYAEGGVDAALNDKPRPGGIPKLDGKQQAFVIALACSDTPNGQERWSMQMLADKIVELGVVQEPVSHDTVRRILKKMTLSRGSKNNGVSLK
jgi:transposase